MIVQGIQASHDLKVFARKQEATDVVASNVSLGPQDFAPAAVLV
jgi:hypothetical protein